MSKLSFYFDDFEYLHNKLRTFAPSGHTVRIGHHGLIVKSKYQIIRLTYLILNVHFKSIKVELVHSARTWYSLTAKKMSASGSKDLISMETDKYLGS
jgi:hypothetical protein